MPGVCVCVWGGGTEGGDVLYPRRTSGCGAHLQRKLYSRITSVKLIRTSSSLTNFKTYFLFFFIKSQKLFI